MNIRPARAWTDPRLLAWTALTVLLSPLPLLAKLRRHFLLGYEWEFDPRRWRVPELAPDVPPARVVFVGAGPGELTMIDRIVEEIEARRPDLAVGICLRNLDALAQLRTERPARRLSVWPFDSLLPVVRWLRAERPELVVFTERYRFTTLTVAVAAAGARLGVVNARGRRREGLFYRLAAPFYRWQFGGFAFMTVQDEASERALRSLAPPDCRIEAVGSLKADLRRKPLTEAQATSLRDWLHADPRPLVAVGSTTDPEEEAFVLDAFLELRRKVPCRLLLAPRDVRRLGSTQDLLAARGLSVSRRSLAEGAAEVCLLDTFGELDAAYAHTRAAYVGGFWKGGGGHNVLEPPGHGVPVAYGSGRGHFATEQRLLESAGAGTRVDGPDALVAFWLRFLKDADERSRVGEAGRAVVEASRGAVGRTAAEVVRALDARR